MMTRVTLLGKPIPQFHDTGNGSGAVTAGDVIKALGGDPAAGAISVGGQAASADTTLKPGDSVRQSPQAYHG
jgi:hypothetical protein